MLKQLRKKKTASIDEILPLLIFVFMAITLLIWTINTNSAIQTKNDLNNIARESMLKMETDGYLTTTEKGKLIERLKDKGFYGSSNACKTDIHSSTEFNNAFTNTTIAEAGYGNPVTLNIQVYKKTDFSMFAIGSFKNEVSKMTIHLESTSKQ